MTTEWYNKQRNEYYDIKQQFNDLVNLGGPNNSSGYRITFTYLVLRDGNGNNIIYFLFTPFITGSEKIWDKENVLGWDCQYNIYPYTKSIAFMYIRDDYMYVPKEFYKYIYESKRDIKILSFNPFNLEIKEPEYVFISNKVPLIYKIEYFPEELEYNDDFEMWFKNKTCKNSTILYMNSPLQSILPFPAKNIKLTSQTTGRNFFEIELID